MQKLILFDVDGTLLWARGAPRRAFQIAMTGVYGTAGPIATHAFDGKTDPQIARELLTLSGVPDREIDQGLPRLWDIYLHELKQELSKPGHSTYVFPGVRELLDELQRRQESVLLGLLTGNIEGGAALKLASAQLAAPFRLGAYGSDCERRDGLPAIAVERARMLTGVHFSGPAVVVVGDTPHDVQCGRSLGVWAVGVATGRHDVDSLTTSGADRVFADLTDTSAVLEALLS